MWEQNHRHINNIKCSYQQYAEVLKAKTESILIRDGFFGLLDDDLLLCLLFTVAIIISLNFRQFYPKCLKFQQLAWKLYFNEV